MIQKPFSKTSFYLAAALLCAGTSLAQPSDYKGKPFMDEFHKAGPQTIPGTVECALYDLGGEGVAYHDVDSVNHGAELNHTQKCQPGTIPYVCFFRENEGVDISYIKDRIDLAHKHNSFRPNREQLYIGWAADGEWTNYTVDVKNAGTYKVYGVYQGQSNSFKFSNRQQTGGGPAVPDRHERHPLTDERAGKLEQGGSRRDHVPGGGTTSPDLALQRRKRLRLLRIRVETDSSEWLKSFKK